MSDSLLIQQLVLARDAKRRGSIFPETKKTAEQEIKRLTDAIAQGVNGNG